MLKNDLLVHAEVYMIDDVFPFMESFHFSRQTMAINDGTWEVGSESLSWGGVCVRVRVCMCVHGNRRWEF